MCCWAIITTLCLLNVCVGTLIKGSALWQTNAIWCRWHWRHCYCSSLLGIHALFQVQTFLAVLWPSAANLLFLLIFQQECVENWHLHLLQLSLIPATSPSALLPAQNCNAIGIWTPCLAPWTNYLTSTWPQSLQTRWHFFLLPAPFSQMPRKVVWASLNFPSPDPGGL